MPGTCTLYPQSWEEASATEGAIASTVVVLLTREVTFCLSHTSNVTAVVDALTRLLSEELLMSTACADDNAPAAACTPLLSRHSTEPPSCGAMAGTALLSVVSRKTPARQSARVKAYSSRAPAMRDMSTCASTCARRHPR